MRTPIDIEVNKSLENLLGTTGGLRPTEFNDEPDLSPLEVKMLSRAIAAFQPDTETQLAYGILLQALVERGGQVETPEERTEIRRLERQVYLDLGFAEEDLAPFYDGPRRLPLDRFAAVDPLAVDFSSLFS